MIAVGLAAWPMPPFLFLSLISSPLLISIETPAWAWSSLVKLLYIREFHSWRYVSQSDSLNLVSDKIAMSTLPLILLKSACLFFVVDPMPPTFLHLSLRVAGLQSLTPASLLMVVLLLK